MTNNLVIMKSSLRTWAISYSVERKWSSSEAACSGLAVVYYGAGSPASCRSTWRSRRRRRRRPDPDLVRVCLNLPPTVTAQRRRSAVWVRWLPWPVCCSNVSICCILHLSHAAAPPSTASPSLYASKLSRKGSISISLCRVSLGAKFACVVCLSLCTVCLVVCLPCDSQWSMLGVILCFKTYWFLSYSYLRILTIGFKSFFYWLFLKNISKQYYTWF